MGFKKWILPKEDDSSIKILAKECGISELVASILSHRGYTNRRETSAYLDIEGELTSPRDLKDMDKAASRINQAVEEFERIAVYGDYDCDGITATAMLYSYLSGIGADVIYYIPERDGDGYGLTEAAVESLSEQGVTLLITVDNGISAIDAIDLAGRRMIDVIITDHHQVGKELPCAIAIVNPHQDDCKSQFKELCGAGVVYKLITAMEGGDYMSTIESFGDLLAIGTIGDIVPLAEENRVFVKHGLEILKRSSNIGLVALMAASGVKVETLTSQTVAFSIVPRINAAGRMGKAGLAIKLLLSEDEEEAADLAAQLDAFNKQRQTDEQAILKDIDNKLSADKTLLLKRVLVLSNPEWNHGIIGIVCSKLIERYGKPVLLITAGEEGILKGSGRSVGDFHLFNALSSVSSHLLQFGGHKLAAGFSLAQGELKPFAEALEAYAAKKYDLMPQYSFNIDKQLLPDELTVENIKSLSVLEPFGAKSEQPLFLLSQCTITAVKPISEGKHQRLSLVVKGANLMALYFGMSTEKMLYKPADVVDIVVNADINEYNQTTSVSLKIKDIRPSAFVQEKFFSAKGYFEKIMKSEAVAPNIIAAATPTREEIGVVYLLIKKGQCDIDNLYIKVIPQKMNYCKFRITIEVLAELNLITVVMTNVSINDVQQKVDLNKSLLLNHLKQIAEAN